MDGEGLRQVHAEATPAEKRQFERGATRAARDDLPGQAPSNEPVPRQSLNSPEATCRWKEQSPFWSQARHVQPGQAHEKVPTIACTRSRWAVQSRPCRAGDPQGLWQLMGQTHPVGTATVPSGETGSCSMWRVRRSAT